VLSVAEHAGWAHVLGVTALADVPYVAARRRVTLIESGLPTQPFHHEATAMTDDAANALITKVRRSVAVHAADALRRIAIELEPAHAVVALVIRESPFDHLPDDYAVVRKSYRLLCSADGMLYQLALRYAARELNLAVQLCRRGAETSLAAHALGVTSAQIEKFVSGIGRPSGPPWTQEHRRAYAAGIAVLAEHRRGPLKVARV
jgi:hypothetical protein